MRPLERQRAIVSLVERQGDLTVEEAGRTLGISPATVRRDFVELSRRGALNKTWGGVKRSPSAPPSGDMLPSSLRENLNAPQKDRIARRACELVHDGDVLIIDGGTTTLRMAHYLANRPVRILTNSILIAHRIDAMRSVTGGAEVFLAGGFLYPGSGLLVGPEAVQSLGQYHAKWAFLSVGGLDAEGGTNTNHLVVESERAMIRMAESVVVMADSSKWHRKEMVRAFAWNEVTRLVTDVPPIGVGNIHAEILLA
jgi:DeoR/GlpR family transcriptional regulator of sugar metabolism